MDMKGHILAALREQLDRWEILLGHLSEPQRQAPLLPSEWTVKNVLTHLWIWQKRSIARIEAGLRGTEPDYPAWVPGIDPDGEGGADPVNAWITQTYGGLPWEEVYRGWSEGFRRFLAEAEKLSERDLLDSSRAEWQQGYSLADTLIASYDHHQEHYEKLVAWLREHGELNFSA